MSNYYEKNLELLLVKRKLPIEMLLEADTLEVEVGLSDDGNQIIGIRKENYIYWLNSLVDSESSADKWLEQFGELDECATFVIIGIANGIYFKKLHEKFPKNIILVYEPSPNIFRKWVENEPDENLILCDYIFYATGEIGKELLRRYYYNFINYSNMKFTQWRFLPGYFIHFEALIGELCKTYINSNNEYIVNRNTKFYFGRPRMQKVLDNCTYIGTESSVDDLIRAIKDSGINERPAFLIAAGPSLDKNIKLLRQVQGKAFIIAVDAAQQPLEKNGIIPDAMATIDSMKELRCVESEAGRNVPLIMELSANPELVKKHTGKKFISAASFEYINKILIEKRGNGLGLLRTGGSVANNCLSFLIDAGFKKIVFVGQDYAYETDKSHAEGTYIKEEEYELDKSKEYIDIEGYYGHKVRTEWNMYTYLCWTEMEIKSFPDVCYINATEGGANIAGAVNMKLEEVIDRECKDLTEYDFGKLIQSVKPYYEIEGSNSITQLMKSEREKMQGLKAELETAIEKYRKLDKIKKEEETEGATFQELLNEIEEFNIEFERRNEKLAIEYYEAEEDYKIQEEIHNVKSDQDEEWDEIINIGIRTLNMYIRACVDFLEDTIKYENID